MIHTQTPEKLAQQQKMNRELAAVLMGLSTTPPPNATNKPQKTNQRKGKGVKKDEKR